MPISSNSLFHYTRGGIEAIKGILENGFRVSYNREYHISTIAAGSKDITGLKAPASEKMTYMQNQAETHYLHIPMVSFCDIPINSINRHLEKYGTPISGDIKNRRSGYAIGMSRLVVLEMFSYIDRI